MIDQPPPQRGLEPVYYEARRRVNEALDHQFEKGRERYGTVLRTFNGRDVSVDMLQEGADLLMYATQLAMQYEVVIELLARAATILQGVEGHLEPEDPYGTDIWILLGDIERCIEPSASGTSASDPSAASTPGD